MTILLIIIHVIVCLALILIVLLQTGKGAATQFSKLAGRAWAAL